MGGGAGELAEVDLDGLGTGEDGAWLGAGGGNGRDVEGGSGAGEDGREEAGPGLVAVDCGDELARPLVGVTRDSGAEHLTRTCARFFCDDCWASLLDLVDMAFLGRRVCSISIRHDRIDRNRVEVFFIISVD
jgi:hypothetical protein